MKYVTSLYRVILTITLTLMSSMVFATEKSSVQRILVWGDSLSAAYGIPAEQGWVQLLQDKLGDAVTVTNGSISGETTSGGLTRLPEALKKHQPDLVILELGANDGLRGQSLAAMRNNLEQMIELAKQNHASVMLIGILLPPNYGAAFTERFADTYKQIGDQYQLAFLPFLLEGVALDFALMQADGLHPNAKAQPKILDNVWEVLQPLLSDVTKSPEASEAEAANTEHDT